MNAPEVVVVEEGLTGQVEIDDSFWDHQPASLSLSFPSTASSSAELLCTLE